MNPSLSHQPVLTDAELDLIVELLERERSDLPAEIHHTRTVAVREELHRRLDSVAGLLRKLAPEKAA